MFPEPNKPELKHFHDPDADLTTQDLVILKVFNNWPGYPPFWAYLRLFVSNRDNHRCQVSGCPSRTSLHIHHKTSVSSGGEHVPSNLVTLCDFHHALEPAGGHERIWGKIKNRYFTMVRSHQRHNRKKMGYHNVRAHVRRLELVTEIELNEIKDYYGLNCTECRNDTIDIRVDKEVKISCSKCGFVWTAYKGLTEETGPRLTELLIVTKNEGDWKAKWDMLTSRKNTVFKSLLTSTSTMKKTTIKTISKLDNINICPKCGSPMRLIKPKSNQRWKPFWGCTMYKITGCKVTAEYK